MELVKILCRLGIFLVCAQTVVHFRPKASYEKYLRLLVGSMVLLQILAPLLTRRGISWDEEWEAVWDFSQVLRNTDVMTEYGTVDMQEEGEGKYGGMDAGESVNGETDRMDESETIEITIEPIQVEVD